MNKALIWTFIVGFLVSMLYVATASAEGNPDKGKKGFKKCASCHSIDEGGKNKTGPNLWNIMRQSCSYNQTFTNAGGCDSVHTLNVTI